MMDTHKAKQTPKDTEEKELEWKNTQAWHLSISFTAVPWKLSLLQGSYRNFTQMFPLLKSPNRIFQDLVIVQDSHFYIPQIVAQLHTQFV